MRGHYIFKVPDTEVTMVAGGFADGIHFSDFRWQHHYTQGRQLMTTDQIKQVCPPEIWQAISAGIFPELDRLKAHFDNIQFRRLTQAEEELQAQVNLHWYLREVILQDSCFLYPKYINSRLWRDIELFSDPYSPFMMWLREVLTPAVQKLQQQADRLHDSIIRAPLGQSVLDQARAALGIRQATTTAHSRQLLAKAIELMDAQHLGSPTPEPEQEPQPACAPISIKPQFMHVMPKDVTSQDIGLMPLWHHWGRHLRQYYHSAYATPSQPPLHRLPFRNPGERDRFNDYKEMLLEVDRQVEDAWRAGKVKDDNRKLAAAKVISAWDAKMRSYAYTRADGQARTGLSVDETGKAFRRANTKEAKKNGPHSVIYVKQSGKKHTNATSTAIAFVQYFTD